MHEVISDPPFQFLAIGGLIKRDRLKIPPNQREYAWENKQVQELFQDFENAIRTHQKIYFLGTIVVTKGHKNVPEVVDGQQRLATITMIIAAIRDYYLSRKEKELADNVDQNYLFKFNRRERYAEPKLTLNTYDNEYFRKRVICTPDSSERKTLTPFADLKKESHKKIDYAANRADVLIKNLVVNQTDFRNIQTILEDWLDFIDQHAYIILLTVPDETNAFLMFETLNDRGLKTSQADLVKNYLFQQATENRLMEAQQKWSKMVSVLETLGIDDIVMTYLRHLVIALYGPTREKDIFDKIRNNVSGSIPAISFSEKLENYADSYAAILNSGHSKWANYPYKIRRSIDTLKELNVRQIRPLMLAVAQCFDPMEADIAFRAFINWTVRFLIVGGMRGGQLEDAYGNKAFEVTSGKITTTKQLLDNLTNIPKDVDFQNEFASAKVSQHILAEIFPYRNGKSFERTSRRYRI